MSETKDEYAIIITAAISTKKKNLNTYPFSAIDFHMMSTAKIIKNSMVTAKKITSADGGMNIILKWSFSANQ